MARQLFYEATRAYKTGDFPKAADKFKEGLATLEGPSWTNFPTIVTTS